MAATSHLESFAGGQSFSTERSAQLRSALGTLNALNAPNVLFAGDMNWDEKRDEDMARHLPSGWRDAWPTLQRGLPGYTYDGQANAMLGHRFQNRFDRVLFKLQHFEPASVRLVGQEPIPGVTYEKTLSNGGSKRMPVCPSDHFGVLFTMRRIKAAGMRAA